MEANPTASIAAVTTMIGNSLVVVGWAISPVLPICRHLRRPIATAQVNLSVVVWTLVAGGFGLTALGIQVIAPTFDWLALPLALGGTLVGAASALEIHLRRWRWRREDLKREEKGMPDVSEPNLS